VEVAVATKSASEEGLHWDNRASGVTKREVDSGPIKTTTSTTIEIAATATSPAKKITRKKIEEQAASRENDSSNTGTENQGSEDEKTRTEGSVVSKTESTPQLPGCGFGLFQSLGLIVALLALSFGLLKAWPYLKPLIKKLPFL